MYGKVEREMEDCNKHLHMNTFNDDRMWSAYKEENINT